MGVRDDLAGATVLSVDERRWDVRFRLRLIDGTEVTMVASADSFYTGSSNIWFGTEQEHREEYESA